HALRPAGSLSSPRLPLSRGSNLTPTGEAAEVLERTFIWRQGLLMAAAGLALGLAFSVQAVPAGEIFEVKEQQIDDLKSVFGTVQSTDVVNARVRTGGTVASLLIGKDSEVQTGDLIATVADQKLALRIKSLDAQIVGLKSRAETAKTEADRQEQLAARGFAASAKLDEARAAYQVAANALKSAEAERAVLTKQVEEGDVLAPAQGRVLSLPVTEGTVVMPGETIAKIAANAYVLRLELPERHARFMHKGDPVLIEGRELTQTNAPASKGTIVLIYPEIQDGRVIADAKAEGLGKFFVGERVLVLISAGKREAIVVPRAYVFRRFGLDFVRLLRRDGGVDDVTVQPGQAATINGEAGGVEILAGVRPGDRLVQP
ncbi:MAG: efflux RND transporter periplasmic adaptor subunit, partial [Rhodomicrobium sp.]